MSCHDALHQTVAVVASFTPSFHCSKYEVGLKILT